MADYTYGQLETLWTNAGGSRTLAPLMAAIALAESGGNPDATNPNDNNGTQTSWGLWQISNGTHNQPVQGILTPSVNAQQAVAKYQSQGLGAWGTYTSGDYEKYYKGSTPAASLPQGGGQQQATLTSFGFSGLGWAQWIEGVLGPIGDIMAGNQEAGQAAQGAVNSGESLAQSLGAIAELVGGFLQNLEWLFVPSHWVRVLAFIGGFIFLIPGLYALMKSGQGSGDASLAIGILLVTMSGFEFFLAFHNLPDYVDNLQTLLGWIRDSISAGRAADTPSTEATL
jgi:hypothetical protein